MMKLIKSCHPFKREKIKPSEIPSELESDCLYQTQKENNKTPTCKLTPTSTIFQSHQHLQFFRNDILPESYPSNYHSNSYPSNFSSKIIEPEIKKDDKAEIMTYIRCLFHDFRSPLNNISLGIDILDETILKDHETQEIINNMKESSKYITNALNGFLNIKNIVSGNTDEFIQIHNKNFNVINCIKKTEKMLLYEIKSKGLCIEYDLSEVSENDENVYGDSSNLQHIFMNLLSNAVKFSEPNTKIVLKLTVKKETSKKQDNKQESVKKMRFTYVIIDENKHIDPGIKRELFQKYNTSNTTTGTGLGLYICKKIAELYDGKIEHEYNKPTGNIFRVEFALGVGKPTTPSLVGNKWETTLREGVVGSPRPLDAIGGASRPQTVGFPTTFYIVDDCSISRKMLRTLLGLKVDKNEGVIIQEEPDGLDLIKKMEITENLQKTNVIFIDNQMSNLNGILATKILRALGYKNYIIGITGNDEKKDVDEFKKNGADYVFTKPFTKDKLNDMFCVFERTSFQKPSV